MPQTVNKLVKAKDIRKNDRLAEYTTPEPPAVLDHSSKQVWMTLWLDDGTTKRIRREDDISVLRDEPTEEEKQAHRDEFARESLRDNLRDMLKDTPLKALDAVITKARDTDPDYAYDVLTSWNLPGVLKTQAVYRQALAIRANVHREGGHIAVEDATLDELVTAYAAWWYANVERKMLDTGTDPTSRSTSVISNLLEDLNTWAIGRIVYNIRWTGAADMIERRVEEMKAKRNS